MISEMLPPVSRPVPQLLISDTTGIFGGSSYTALGVMETGTQRPDLALYRRITSRNTPLATTPPVVAIGRLRLPVADVETYDNGQLLFARDTSRPDSASGWKLFFQETGDQTPIFLSSKDIADQFLRDYRESGITARAKALTYPVVVKRKMVPGLGHDILEEDLTYQNGHSLRLRWKKGGSGLGTAEIPTGRRIPIWHLSPQELETILERIPLSVISQIDEINLRNHYGATIGQTQIINHRRIIHLYPMDVTGLSLDAPTQMSQAKRTDLYVRFFYTLCHEGFGHTLVDNRYLRRELIKIIASGETPPTSYAAQSPVVDEWFAEGVAEAWTRDINRFLKASEPFKKTHPYLLKLLMHCLGVLEGTVESINENINRWLLSMKPTRLKLLT